MELNLLKERKSPLLDRRRVSYMVEYQGRPTPNIIEFKEAIAGQLKVKKELVAVRHVYQRFGFSKAKVIAHIYSSVKDKQHFEKMKKAEKKELENVKKEAEEKAKSELEAKKAKEEALKSEEDVKESGSEE
jgi:ribosomal protein S24E